MLKPRLRNAQGYPPPGVPGVDWASPVNIGLLGLWQPGVTYYDISRRGGTATPNGTIPNVPSRLGLAANFGSGQNVYLGLAPITILQAQQYSISAWINLDASVANTQYCVMTDTFGTTGLLVYNGAIDVHTGVRHQGGSLSAGTWYSVIGTWDGTADTLTGYVNGVQVVNTTWSPGGNKSLNCIGGGIQADSGVYSIGLMAICRLYGRVLTQQDAFLHFANPWAGLIFPSDRAEELSFGRSFAFFRASHLAGIGAVAALARGVARNDVISRRKFLLPKRRLTRL